MLSGTRDIVYIGSVMDSVWRVLSEKNLVLRCRRDKIDAELFITTDAKIN